MSDEMHKPIVFVVGKRFSPTFHAKDNHHTTDAVEIVLRSLGFFVWRYENKYQLEEVIANFTRLASLKRVVLVVTSWDRYEDETGGYAGSHVDIIKMVRTVDPLVPILILNPYGDTESLLKTYQHCHCYFDHDPKVVQLYKLVHQHFAPQSGLFDGAVSLSDISYIRRELTRVDKNEAPSDDDPGCLGFSGSDTRASRQAMRLRLTPSQLLRRDWDAQLKSRKPIGERDQVDSKLVEAAIKKIEAFDEVMQKSFENALLHAEGYARHPSGRVMVIRGIGRGQNISGFAIDLVTLESIEVNEFGLHQMAPQWLRDRIETIDLMRLGRSLTEEEDLDLHRRIIRGTVIYGVDGFKSPICILCCLNQLDGTNLSETERATLAQHLITHCRMVPLDQKYRLIRA